MQPKLNIGTGAEAATEKAFPRRRVKTAPAKAKWMKAYASFVAILAILISACADDIDHDAFGTRDCINLSVSVPLASAKASAETRAVATDLNEFKVNSLHLFFFPITGFEESSTEYVHDIIIDGAFEYSRSLRLELPDNALKAGGIFGVAANECRVYAVANVDESLLAGKKTVEALKATIIGSGFDRTEVQPDFAMDALTTLTLDRSNRLASGNIELQRAAAKLTLSVNLPESIDVTETVVDPFTGTSTESIRTYTPHPEQMHVWLANGVHTSPLNALPEQAAEDNLYSNDILLTPGNGSAFAFADDQPKYKYIQEIPFYSYPNSWDPYSPTANSYLTLVIPWSYEDNDGVTRQTVTYYRISVQPNRNQIERNTHYDIRVTIGRLGGQSIQQPIDMLLDWNYAMQWNTQTLTTDIKEVSYLLLNNNDYVAKENAYVYYLDNETEISIPYISSHPVKIARVTLQWHDYYNDADRTITLSPQQSSTYHYSDIDTYKAASDFAALEIDSNNALLDFKRDMLHILWNGSRPEIQAGVEAINSYTITVELEHDIDAQAGASEKATVKIIQTPARYITSQKRTQSGHRFVNNNNKTYNTRYTYYGYVTTNDQNPGDPNRRLFWAGSIHDQTAWVKNKNTYIINISKFDEDDDYIIGDPRSRTVDNYMDNDRSATATWAVTDDASRRLQYYYPADGGELKKDVIAPIIRVASQWGVTYQIYRQGAEKRCASYQENGRPAGRWRLPTMAEIKYICELSNQKFIPYLFGTGDDTADYWCATGGVSVDNKNGTVTLVDNPSGRRAVRCVYDEWYWDTDTLTNKNTFHWGDRPRSESRVRALLNKATAKKKASK